MIDYNNFTKPDKGSCPQPDHIMLSFCGDAKTEIAVTWRTSTDVPDGYMLFTPLDGSEETRVDSINREFKSDIDISMIHWAQARGLKSATKYRYTVGNDKYRSEEFTFETEKENCGKFKFLFITDTQQSQPWPKPSYENLNHLLKKVLSENPDCKFILTGGDNCDDGQNEIQWNGFFSGMQGIAESMPLMMCTGNHDNRGFMQYLPEPVGKFYMPHAFFFDDQFEFSYPRNGPEDLLTENYSFDYGNSHFAIMGINEFEKINTWLYDDLQKSDKAWKFGVYHFPVYPVMPEGGDEDSYHFLGKGIDEGRLDVLFGGHEHSFARTYPMRHNEMFDKPSQGTVHYNAGNAGRNIFCTNMRKIWHPYFYPQEEPLILYVIIEVDGNVFHATAYLEDGRIVDDYIIDKDNDRILPHELAPVFKQTKMSFKGQIPELACRDLYCIRHNEQWYCAFGNLMHGIGAKVEKTPGKVNIQIYKRNVTFEEGSEKAQTETGEFPLSGEVIRHKEQLYVPVSDAAEIFGMRWYYAEHNNLINFDYAAEDKTYMPQP